MSFVLPESVERDVERFAEAEHITTSEALVRLVESGLKTAGRPILVTDEQIRKLKAVYPGYGLLEDVSDEKIDRMVETIARMKEEGFTPIA